MNHIVLYIPNRFDVEDPRIIMQLISISHIKKYYLNIIGNNVHTLLEVAEKYLKLEQIMTYNTLEQYLIENDANEIVTFLELGYIINDFSKIQQYPGYIHNYELENLITNIANIYDFKDFKDLYGNTSEIVIKFSDPVEACIYMNTYPHKYPIYNPYIVSCILIISENDDISILDSFENQTYSNKNLIVMTNSKNIDVFGSYPIHYMDADENTLFNNAIKLAKDYVIFWNKNIDYHPAFLSVYMSKLDNGNVDYISMESIKNNGINMEPKYQGYYETTMIRKDKLVEKFDSNEELYWGRQWYNCDYVSILSDKYAKLYSKKDIKSCTIMIPYVEFSWYHYILSYFKFLIFW